MNNINCYPICHVWRNFRFWDCQMFDSNIVGDVQPDEPPRQPFPDRGNEFRVFPDEYFVHGPVGAKQPELFRDSVVDQSLAKHFSVTFHQRKDRVLFHKHQNLKKIINNPKNYSYSINTLIDYVFCDTFKTTHEE